MNKLHIRWREQLKSGAAVVQRRAIVLVLIVIAFVSVHQPARADDDPEKQHDEAAELVRQVRHEMYKVPMSNSLGAIAAPAPAVLKRFHDLGEPAVGPLLELLCDPHPACRTVALQAVTVIGEERATALNVTLLVDRSDSVRMAAAQNLGLMFVRSPITKYSAAGVDTSVANFKHAQTEMLSWLNKDALVDGQLPLPARKGWTSSDRMAALYGGLQRPGRSDATRR